VVVPDLVVECTRRCHRNTSCSNNSARQGRSRPFFSHSEVWGKDPNLARRAAMPCARLGSNHS
jgi:hypothetical protein